MMKKLVVLFIAVAALFAFSACEPYAVTLDETGSVELDDVGAGNYTLKGKTLVRTEYDNITKTVVTTVINDGVITGSTTTTTYIPYLEKTTTVTFADDNTYSKSYTEVFLAAADDDYRTTTKTDTKGAINTITNTTYSGWNGYYNFSNAVHFGLANKTRKTTSVTGSWELVKKQYGPNDSQTYHYFVTTPSTTETTTSFDVDTTFDAVETDETDSTTKSTYKVAGSDTVTTTSTSDPSEISYWWIREDADGNDVLRIGNDLYTVQP